MPSMLSTYKKLDSFSLKILAIFTMIIDHVGALFLPEFYWMRWIGRLAFPIFCFLLVEGFFHTSNIKKYMFRLGIFALISEIPFDLFIETMLKDYGRRTPNITVGNYNAFMSQNIFFTLFIGLVAVYFMDQVVKKYQKNYVLASAIEVVIAVGAGMLAQFIGADYGLLGIFYIMIFYLYRGQTMFICFFLTILTALLMGGSQIFAVLAMPFIACYSGEKGRSLKYFFYGFYPVHLAILVGIWFLLYGGSVVS